MRKFLVILALIAMPIAAFGQSASTPADGIQNAIQGQMNAFSEGDVATAWSYASPTIQSMFGDQERFGAMVESGYPMVWQPGQVSYLELRRHGPWLLQTVQVIDQAGRPHYLGYQMVQIGGEWRINGVSLLDPPGVGA